MDLSDSFSKYDNQDPQEEISHLTEINKQLKDELDKVKAEFAQTVNVIPNMESLYSENNQLKKSLFTLQSKNDDLQKRLNIALQTNNEILNSKESSKNNVTKEYENQITDLQVEVSTLKAENESMRANFQKQIKNSESSMYSIQSENSVLNSQVSKLLKVAEIKFSQSFKEIPELIAFFNKPQKQDKKEQSDDKCEEINCLNEKLQEMKSKLQTEKQKVKTLQMGVIKMKKKIENDNLKTEQEITQLHDQVRQKDNEIRRLTLLNQQKLIVKTPPKTRNQFCQVMTIIEDIDSENLRHELAAANSQLNENSTTISMLKMQLDATDSQLKELETTKNQLSNKLKNTSNENEALQSEVIRQKRLNEKLSKEVEETLTQLAAKTAESTLPKEMLEGENAKLKLEQKNAERTIERLETIMQTQKEEITELSNTKEKLINMIEKQSKIFGIMDEMISNQKPPEVKSVEKIITVDPQFEWQFGNLPEEILDIVVEIGENDSLKIESRIKSIFIVVNKYIENQLNSRQKEKTSLEESVTSLSKQLEEYKAQIVAAFEMGEEATPETAPELITKYIVLSKRLENELAQVKDEDLRLLHMTECEDFDSVIHNMMDLKENSENLTNQIKEEKKKRSVLRQQITKVLASKDKEIEQKTGTLKKMNDSSRKQIEKLQTQIEKLQDQNKKLIEQLTNLPEANEQSNNDQPQNIMKQNDDDDASQLQISRETTQLSYQVEDLTSKIESLNKAVNKWKEVAKKAQDEVSMTQKRISEINQLNDQHIEKLMKDFDEEREHLQGQLRELAEKLENEAQNHKEALQSLTESLSQAHQRLDKATQELSNHKFEMEKINLCAASRVETAERAKKLTEAQLKAQILSIESNHSMQLEEEKQKGEQSKRNLIETFVKSFREFTDISEKLNEDCFREVIRKVRGQIEKGQKTENAIRKLIKAKDEDSTEDALTQFIIRMHPQFQSSQ
ncbi:hypothetical protein TRFO_01196 [Tritrichomonas foetus]|uniref:Uncharacterized protein n=1 Tax=Tritrichomonas foetus TaxID=1144522 RepID=A0A1J4KP84_9EUKA|nr:hypothetical protein [Tritrichomonas foetus]OHT11237.1 hypothetical protein TRFO_01196 [Tritrichomonas foetus]|eukprot:OHT11237.1 hypothetical protein TRFO_01196 [Tritrichomonas foetus]